MDKKDKTRLVGRDPAMGRVAFKTGVVKTRRDKLRNRNSKLSRREKSRMNDDY